MPGGYFFVRKEKDILSLLFFSSDQILIGFPLPYKAPGIFPGNEDLGGARP